MTCPPPRLKVDKDWLQALRRKLMKQPEAGAHNNARLPNRPPLREA
ncbi:MAG: hypothetical protein LBD24_09155 [Spirochaetaceae bacterium]|nr:hypothetical protein [Spirochaetaceae bacterium]